MQGTGTVYRSIVKSSVYISCIRSSRQFLLACLLVLLLLPIYLSFLFLFFQINELKVLHQAGGRSTFTWMKQPGDNITNLVGAGLCTFGMLQSTVGYWRLATGKGKLD